VVLVGRGLMQEFYRNGERQARFLEVALSSPKLSNYHIPEMNFDLVRIFDSEKQEV
jgi:hypothetical protein